MPLNPYDTTNIKMAEMSKLPQGRNDNNNSHY